MQVFLLAALLSAAPTPTGDDEVLTAYMTALSDVVVRWRRVGELMVGGHVEEAQALLDAPSPPVLESDFAEQTFRSDEWEVPRLSAFNLGATFARQAAFLRKLGLPELATPAFESAADHGVTLPGWAAEEMLRELVAVDAGQMAVLLARYPKLKPVKIRSAGAVGRIEESRLYVPPRGRARLAVELWNEPLSPGLSRLRRLDLLASLLPGTGSRLAQKAALRTPELPEGDRVRRLSALVRISSPSDAYAAWQELADGRASAAGKARALMEMAAIRRREGRPRQAVALLERARDTDGATAPDAQWQLSQVLFEAGDYAAALESFRRSENELPRASCCGESHAIEHALWEGLVLEQLDRVAEAVGHYVYAFTDTRVTQHLLDLYESAGQIEDLERILGERTPEDPAGYSSAVPALTLMVMHRMARARDWASLISLLQDPGLPDPSRMSRFEVRYVYAAEALRLVSRACDETVPLLSGAIGAQTPPAPRWVMLALGRCGVSAAVPEPKDLPQAAGDGPLAPLPFPPVSATSLPSHPQVVDHTPRPHRGPERAPCMCM